MASPSAMCRGQYAPDAREVIYACHRVLVRRAEPLESYAATRLAEINLMTAMGRPFVRAVAARFDTWRNRGVARHCARTPTALRHTTRWRLLVGGRFWWQNSPSGDVRRR